MDGNLWKFNFNLKLKLLLNSANTIVINCLLFQAVSWPFADNWSFLINLFLLKNNQLKLK